MKKEAPACVWHKRHGKMMPSKILHVQHAPHGTPEKAQQIPSDPAQRFWKNLKAQIVKSLSIFIVSIFCGCLLGCQPPAQVLPLGIWHRDAVYVNGELNNERKATFIFDKTKFQYFEAGCEMKGVVSYQKEAFILGIQESDCSVARPGERIYCGFDMDPDGKTLRLTRDNQFNDSIREVYHLKGAR